MNISFANSFNSFQSVQAAGSFKKIASSSTATIKSRSDVLTLSSQRMESFASVYQRPVMPVGNTLEARLFTQKEASVKTSATDLLCQESNFDDRSHNWFHGLNDRGIWAFGTDFSNAIRFEKSQQRYDRMGWGFHESINLGSRLAGAALGHDFRSTQVAVQAWLEATEHTLNSQIDHALKASGISLDEKDRLNFNIDQFGKISITGDLDSANGRNQILEDILNGDDAIRSNLFLYQVQKNRLEQVCPMERDNGLQNLMISRAYDWAHGNITGAQETFGFGKTTFNFDTGEWDTVGHEKFPIEFSFQDGKIFQGNNVPEDRVFSDRLDSLADLGKVIGLDETAAKDIQSFVAALEQNIAVDAPRLTGLLNAALNQANLGDVKTKITFSQDAEGNIVVEGNLRENQKKRLAEIINGDPELSELIKTQSAKQAILDELKASITNEPVFINSPSAWKRHAARPAGFNLSQEGLAVAREQLLKNFLDRNGISMSDLEGDLDGVLAKHGELGEIKGLRNEINRLLTPATKPTATEAQPLLAMKRGELVEVADANKRLGIDEAVADLKARLNFWMAEYNKFIDWQMPGHPELMLTGFTVTFDHTGKPSLEVRTAGGNSASGIPETFEKSAPGVPTYLTNVFTYKPGAYQDLALAILDAHDDEHGDVQEYRHSVIIESGIAGGQYRVESPDADKAALQELAELTQEIGIALGDFFGETMRIESPFNIIFASDGLLLLNSDLLSSVESQTIQKVLENINHFLLAEEAGEDTEGMLPPQLTGIGEKLLALKEAKDRILDKSLLPKEGVGFWIN